MSVEQLSAKIASNTENTSNVSTSPTNTIHDNGTNLLEWYNNSLTKHFELNKTYGQIYCVSNVALKAYGYNTYHLDFTENINGRLPYYSKLLLDSLEVIYISHRVLHPDLIVSVIYKKMSEHKLSNGSDFYACNAKTIKSIIKSTINEFQSTPLINLIKKYDLYDEIKTGSFNFIKKITDKGFIKRCAECEERNKNTKTVEISDMSNPNKILIMTKCCNSYQIADN